MDNKKPEFAFEDRSVIALITQLHAYFRDLQSYYTVARGGLVSQLDKVTDSTKLKDLQEELAQVNKKIDYFHVLNNSISTVDVILHTEEMIAEFNSSQNRNDT